MPQSRSQGQAPSAPCAGCPCCPSACGADAAPRPPPRRGHPRRLRSRRGKSWLVPGSSGLGGDELAGVGVDVVEVVVVVVVVVGVVRRHLLDAEGDAPHRLHVRPRGRPAPRPPPFDPPSPPGSDASFCLFLWDPWRPCPCPWTPFRHPALAVGPAPCHPRPWPARSPTVPRPIPCTWAPCPRPCAPFPCPGPFPAPCPESRRPLPAPCPPPLLRPCSPPRVPWPAPCACSWALPLSPPVPRSAPPWLVRSSACAPSRPSWITRRASPFLCSCGSVWPGGERSGAGGRTCRVRPGGKGLGGNGLGGLVWVWVGLAWARYFALSLPTAAVAAGPGEAPEARVGSFPCMLGAAAWPANAVARLARAAVATPRAPSELHSAAAAPLGMRLVPVPGLPPVSAACRGPRSGPRRGSLGLRSPLPARLGHPPGAGRQGLLLGRRERSPRPAQAPGLTARCWRRPPGAAQLAARPAPPPPPASTPRAPRGSPPSTPWRRGSRSGTGGGGGRPAGGSHRSPPSLLSR